MPYHLTPSPACYSFKMIYFVCNGGNRTARQRNSCTQRNDNHGDTTITSHKHDKQSQSLAGVNVSPPKARVRSRDCSMFCINKCKHLDIYYNENVNIVIYNLT